MLDRCFGLSNLDDGGAKISFSRWFAEQPEPDKALSLRRRRQKSAADRRNVLLRRSETDLQTSLGHLHTSLLNSSSYRLDQVVTGGAR